jgi:SAM-dependent methyltransferase
MPGRVACVKWPDYHANLRLRFDVVSETYMHLPTGIPRIQDVDALIKTDLYRRHTDFNREFLRRHTTAMQRYGKQWGLDPYRLWSRRWEYPYAAQRLINYAERAGRSESGKLRILDAGSGVTYFPYYICENLPQAQVICCDYNPSYRQMFDEINAARGNPPVSFVDAALQDLPFDDRSLDAICCISVLEHTDNYHEIVDEFVRVLRPGGLLVVTFDLSLDGRHTLPRQTASELLDSLRSKFQADAGIDFRAELSHMSDSGILSTDHVRATQPELLPWSRPAKVVKAMQDLFKGYGWTGGFRSRTVFCLDVRRLPLS